MYTKTGKSTKCVRLRDGFLLKGRKITNQNGTACKLKLNDLTLYKSNTEGCTLTRDTSCDSLFMLKQIRKIGKSIRDAYHWVSDNVTIYLVMDNTGSHGRNKAKQQYKQMLKQEFNVEISWQVANSPESNIIDLGTWMAVQLEVERRHRL